MSERYGKVFSLPENLYAEGAPVIIAAGALLKDNQTGRVVAQLKLRNISPKTIKAVTVRLFPMNTAGQPLGDAVRYEYLDLSSNRDADFGSKSAIPMPDKTTRSFGIRVAEVIFADNSAWNANDAAWEPLEKPEALDSRLDSEMVKQFQIEYGSRAKNFLLEQKDLWHCICGAVNRREETVCHSCQKSIYDLKNLDLETLKERKDQRVAKEQEQAAQEAMARQESERKVKKALAIVLPVAAVVTALVLLLNNVIIPKAKYNNAVSLMKSGQYEEASALFEKLGDYKDASQMVFEVAYQKALALMDAKNYEDAISVFEMLDGYRDSSEKILDCNTAILDEKYNDAVELMEAKQYEEAIAAFEVLDGYRESGEQIATCQRLIREEELAEEYNTAIFLMNIGSFKKAYSAFMKLDSYKDSAEKAGEIRLQTNIDRIKAAKRGSYVTLGAYEQDNNISNGKEDIQWEVLDKRGSRLLLISSFALDHLPFDQTGEGNTWETCSLRSWLNLDFLHTAFSSEEIELIPTVAVTASKNPQYYKFNKTIGNDTQDKVFLLSTTEYGTLIESRGYGAVSRGTATDYAIAKGSTPDKYGNYSSWWLRTPGSASSYVCTYYVGSGLQYSGTDIQESKDVRPVLWIDLDKLNTQ